MTSIVDTIYGKIADRDPIHGKKLRKNLGFYDEHYYELADEFFKKYERVLQLENKTLDFSVDCYLRMIADMKNETLDFLHTGRYSSHSFEEVNRRVYSQPGIMEYYMHGLIVSQFLWKHHYQMFGYFISTFPPFAGSVKNYLEVGVGHGFYLSQSLTVLPEKASVTAMDISDTSIAMARAFADNPRIDFRRQDIQHFSTDRKFDFITLGEVLEHVGQPLELLLKLRSLLTPDGVLFLTTPTNAPAIDHLYLFRNIEEIRQLVKEAGFRIASDKTLVSEEISLEKAEELKIATLYGAFLTIGNP
jgi:2-polyprenyl-3-methyl-5-hydroxy-6-metoxy-1,4-benzoquinol methylase